MRTLTLEHSGLVLSRIIAGGWQAGRDLWVGIEDAQSIAALRAAFDAGVTTFDTAEDYGSGHSERILAQALGSWRDELVIATKVSWDHLRADQIVAACERSLRNLGTDRIDLYQIHWPAGTFGSESVPLEESMEALVRLQDEGKIRAIGVSNFDRVQLEHAVRLGPVDTVQPPYSLLWRDAERELLPYCHAHQIAVLAYSPLAQGLLTGKIDGATTLAEGDNRLDNRLFAPPWRERALAVVEGMRPIAAALGVSLAQLALAWVAGRPRTAAIAGMRTETQARDDAGAGDLVLTEAIRAELDALAQPLADDLAGHAVMWTWET